MVATLAWGATFVIRVKADDVWWHLAAGERMLRTGSVLRTNTFSFTAPEFEWLSHEWLSEVLFAALYRLGSQWLLWLALALQVLLFATLAHRAFAAGKTPVASAVLTFVASLMSLANFSIRPYLFGNLLLLVALSLADHPQAWGRFRRVGLVALFGVWANLHGSFVFGLGVFALWAVAGASFERRTRFKELGLALLGSVATPHHVKGLAFPFRYLAASLHPSRTFLREVMEWQPVSLDSALGVLLLATLLVGVGVILASRRRPTLVHTVLLLSCAVASLSAVRHLPLAGIALVVVVPRHLEALFTSGSQARFAELERGGSSLIPLGFWAVAAIGWGAMGPLGAQSPEASPGGLLRALEGRAERRIFNAYNWGGALIFAGHPVFIDQRNDCYPSPVFDDFFAVYHLESNWAEVLERWRVDAVAWPAGTKLSAALEASTGWQLAYADDQSVLYVRRVAQ